MFTELKVKNFQSLSESTLELGPINVIIGPSFLGKSAVVRALYCLTRNRFESSFMKKGTAFTSVELSEDDTWIEYDRENSSYYKFSGNPEPYTKIGRDVPADIKNYLKMDEIVFDTDLAIDFNFQRQFDAPFILSLSGFEIAKVFGKLMNLDIVMAASRDIDKDIRALNKEKDAQVAIQDVSIEYIRENFAIELKYALLQKALEVDKEAEELEKQADELLQFIADCIENQHKMKVYNQLLKTLESAEIDKLEAPPEGLEDILLSTFYEEERQKAYKQILDLPEVTFDFDGLTKLEETIVDQMLLDSTIEVLDSVLKSTEGIDDKILTQIDEVSKLIVDGDNINTSFAQQKKDMQTIEAAISAKQAEFSTYIKEHNICPLTNLPFGDSCLKALQG